MRVKRCRILNKCDVDVIGIFSFNAMNLIEFLTFFSLIRDYLSNWSSIKKLHERNLSTVHIQLLRYVYNTVIYMNLILFVFTSVYTENLARVCTHILFSLWFQCTNWNKVKKMGLFANQFWDYLFLRFVCRGLWNTIDLLFVY